MSAAPPDVPAAPRTPRGERTAARLRAAARTVFAQRGFAAARVEDVVAAAGVSHGTFYTYYDNKGAVLEALIDGTEEHLRTVVQAPWEGADPGRTIETVIARFVEVFAADAGVIRAWTEASAHDADLRRRLRRMRADFVHRVADQIAPALRGTGHDPAVAASALVAMVEGYVTRGLTAEGTEGVQDAARRADEVATLATLWLGGLRQLTGERGVG